MLALRLTRRTNSKAIRRLPMILPCHCEQPTTREHSSGQATYLVRPRNGQDIGHDIARHQARPERCSPLASPTCYRLRFPTLLSLGKPMQVVVPSVSLAETLQGAAFTGVRGTNSFGDLPALAADGVGAMLHTLSGAGLRLALVSSDSEPNARVKLGTAAALFSDFDCSASLFGKAAKFRRILQRAGVVPAQAIAIGDETRDIEAARAVGIACGAVTWGTRRPGPCKRSGPIWCSSAWAISCTR
jgi:Haloacid dehalogenase-like hydrolase